MGFKIWPSNGLLKMILSRKVKVFAVTFSYYFQLKFVKFYT